jgi:ribosomal protein L11 methylase PrmA
MRAPPNWESCSALAAVRMGAAFVTVNDIDPQAIEAVKWNAKINQIPIEKLNFDNTNFLDGDIER